jgi:hypothetical protein
MIKPHSLKRYPYVLSVYLPVTDAGHKDRIFGCLLCVGIAHEISARVGYPSSLPHTPMSFEAAHLDGSGVGGVVVSSGIALRCCTRG